LAFDRRGQNVENTSNSVASENVDRIIQMTEKYQEQTDRMLAIIEKLINKCL
jgi:uncharacterized membrane protein